MDVVATSAHRVAQNTDEAVNERIRYRTEASIAFHARAASGVAHSAWSPVLHHE